MYTCMYAFLCYTRILPRYVCIWACTYTFMYVQVYVHCSHPVLLYTRVYVYVFVHTFECVCRIGWSDFFVIYMCMHVCLYSCIDILDTDDKSASCGLSVCAFMYVCVYVGVHNMYVCMYIHDPACYAHAFSRQATVFQKTYCMHTNTYLCHHAVARSFQYRWPLSRLGMPVRNIRK